MRISTTVLFFAFLLLAIAFATAELQMEHKELDSVDNALMDVINKLENQIKDHEKRVQDALANRELRKTQRLQQLDVVQKEHKDRIDAEANYNVQRKEEEDAERELQVREARHRDAQANYDKVHAEATAAIAALDRELQVIHQIRTLLGLKNRDFALTDFSAHAPIAKVAAAQVDTYIGSKSNFLQADQRFAQSVHTEVPVQIYDTCQFTGQSVRLYQSTTDVGAENTQRVQSIKVPKGYAVSVFAAKDYTGASQTFFADTPCTRAQFPTIGSIKITEHIPTPVVFYQHCKFQENGGQSVKSEGDVPSIGSGLDNQYSAVEVPAGWKVIAFSEPNFQGKSIDLVGNVDCLVNLGWNDAISSFRVVKTA